MPSYFACSSTARQDSAKRPRPRAIGQALAAAARGDDADPTAGYCSVAYIEMEAANCDVLLERPDQAVEIYWESLSRWPAVQERDRGLCLARLAHHSLSDHARTVSA